MGKFKAGDTVQMVGRPELTVKVTRQETNRFMPGRFYGRPLTPVEMSAEAVGASPYYESHFEPAERK